MIKCVRNFFYKKQILSQAVYRWSTSQIKLGKPEFALAKYEKIYRVTVWIHDFV